MKSRTERGRAPRHIFFYGTLLPGQAPPEIRPALEELRPLGAAVLRGARLFDLGDFPGAIAEPSGPDLRGQIFRLPPQPEELLRRLDEYEGYDPARAAQSLFVRHAHRVSLPRGRSVNAWVYFYNRSPSAAGVLAKGSYRSRRVAAARAQRAAEPA
ncbi:MAG TPA: gamma-glutamylcyclotransferase family protein [Terriglobales bacterium]|nr:gamma-glutamylcyclotransferase family protein [Terriglobales bacterium]